MRHDRAAAGNHGDVSKGKLMLLLNSLYINLSWITKSATQAGGQLTESTAKANRRSVQWRPQNHEG